MEFLRRLLGRDPVPDLQFAAKGYVQLAVTRRYAPHLDPHHVGNAYAQELLTEGCSQEQGLSARWGGVYATTTDLSGFDDALGAVKATAAEAEMGPPRTRSEATRMYQAAGLLVMVTAHAVDPKEYGRFLRYMRCRA